MVQTPDGYIIFDDTTVEKQHAKQIGLAKPQYSGNAGKVVNGIGVVTCVYVNPALDRSWLIDYRIYDSWEDCAQKLGIDVGKIQALFDTPEVSEQLFRENIKRAAVLGIKASPTILIDGHKFRPAQLLRASGTPCE